MTTRTLVILRHAQAESFAADDHGRVLSRRGEADARAVGEHLAMAGVVPDVVLTSDSARTRATWSGAEDAARAAGHPWSPAVEITRAVYNADTDSLLQLVRETDETATCLLVIGHNPTVSSLALLLDDGDGDVDAAAEMATGHPTAAFAVLTFDGGWGDLAFGTAALQSFVVARAEG